MPYIPPDQREAFDDLVFDIAERIESPGQLNYVMSKIALTCALDSDANYDTYNAIIGVFECAKQEFYRRHVAPYEDIKIAQNGDLFEEQEDAHEWAD